MTRRQKIARAAFGRMLDGLVKRGTLTVIDAEGTARSHGDGGPPKATIRIADPTLYEGLFLNPELKAGEAYMEGGLTFEEGSIRDLLLIFHRNAANLRGRPVRKALHEGVKALRRFHQYNPISRARKNVAHHYDLSNDLYRLFLDDELVYSCAYFETPELSLEAAQKAKLRHIAAKLRIDPGMRILDIGCGWGAMALYLAEHCGAHVTGVTLSERQKALADERAFARGLSDRADFRLCDYREVEGPFDRIVSVGMFEHVGAPFYNRFFAKVRDLLRDDGAALLHSIGRRDGPDATGAWVRKYIFPGGYTPAMSEVFAATERQGLWVTDVEILRRHYADTLLEWERRFQARRADARAMFDERFCRMWEFYLITSEFAFRYGGHMVFQMQLAKTSQALPLTRDYMRAAELALKEKDGG